MRADLEERAEEAAKNARCSLCGQVILEAPGAADMTFGSVRFPVSGRVQSFQFCGECSLSTFRVLK